MIPISWHERFETGEATIDQQHGQLLELIQQLNAAQAEAGEGAAEVPRLLDRIAEWALGHCETEEALMRSAGIAPDYIAHHLQSHGNFLTQLDHLRERYAARASVTQEELAAFLTRSLAQHLLGEDQVMMRRINARRDGPAPDRVTTVPACDEADADEAALSESSLRLFSLISEQKQCLADAHTELAEARAQAVVCDARCRAVLAALPVGVIVQELDGRVVLSNPAAARILGVTEEAMAGYTAADPRWHAVDESGRPVPGLHHPARLVGETGQGQRHTTLGVHRPDGSLVWMSVGTELLDHPARSPDSPPYVVTSFTDITARKQSEDALQESQQRLNLVLERTETGIWDWDFESGTVQFSRSWYTMLGFDPGDYPATLETWERLVHPGDIETAGRSVLRMKDSTHEYEPYDSVFRMRTKDGGWRWINSRAVVVRRDERGHPTRVVGTHVDLTERRRVERALQEQQAKLAGLFRAAPIGIAMIEGQVLAEVNETFCELTGYGRDELLGRDMRFLYSDHDECDRVNRTQDECGAGGGISAVETCWVTKDAASIDVVLHITALPRDDTPAAMLFTVLDVTDRKRMETALGESEEAYRLAMEATQDGVWDWDIATDRVEFSASWRRILGEFEVPAQFESWATRVHPDDWPDLERSLELHLAGDGAAWENEHRLRTRSGDWRWVMGRGRVVSRDRNGKPLRMVGTTTDIGERKSAELQLRELSTRLELAVSIGRIWFFALDLRTRRAEVSPDYLALFGYAPGAVSIDWEFLASRVHPDDRVDQLPTFQRCPASDPSVVEGEYRLRHRDGHWVWISERSRVHSCDPAGRPLRVIGVHVDITARKEAEEALRIGEERLRMSQFYGGAGIWEADLRSNREFWSEAVTHLLGFPDLQSPTWQDYLAAIVPDDRPRVVGAIDAHLKQGARLDVEYRIVASDGRIRWMRSTGQVERAPDGLPLRLRGIVQDVTERKLAERDLTLLSDTIGASLNEIYLFDADTLRFRYVNEGALKNLGYSLSAVRALTPLDLKPQVTAPMFQALVAPLLSGERKVQVFESVHRRADGSLYPVEVHLQLFSHGGERVYLAVIQDITERKSTEASLQASEERFRVWLDATDSVFWTADRDGALSQPSLSLERLTALTREQCLGHGRFAAIHPEDRDTYAATVADAIARGEPFECHLRYWAAAAGEYRWYLERGVPHRAGNGTIDGWLGAGVNVDRQKRAEAAQQDLLRRKDEFIAMLGHELRNPLAPIRNANEVLSNVAGRDPTLQWVHGILDRHTTHLASLVDDLLDVARLLRGKISLQPGPLSVVDLLRQIAESNRPLIAARDQHLTLTMPDESLMIRGDTVRLTQVFDNLLGNAIRYTPDGGQIEFAAVREGPLAVIRVRDSGIGIPEDLLPHIFDPFAQGDRGLDRSEGGLGLGLTVARQLVVLHDGAIAAFSKGVDQGSEFVVRLPLLDHRATGSGGTVLPSEPELSALRARLRILVVDDNWDAASSLTLLLEYHDHAVESARDGPEALEIARRFRPDLVLLDIGLPGMDGFEVALALRCLEEAKRARIIAVTGYAQPEYRARAEAAGFDGYLVKPIRLADIQQLLDSLADMLSDGASGATRSTRMGSDPE